MGAVRMNSAELAQLLRSPSGPVFRLVSIVATQVQARMKARVGKDTHELEQTIVKRTITNPRSGFSIRISSPAEHADLHAKGTKAHVIFPRRARVLAFSKGGQMVYAHRVNHPGTRPNNYPVDAARDVGLRVRTR